MTILPIAKVRAALERAEQLGAASIDKPSRTGSIRTFRDGRVEKVEQ